MNWQDFVPLIQAVIVGIFGLLAGYVFGRAKYRAEVRKLEAEAELAEIKKTTESALAGAQTKRELAVARKEEVETTASLLSLLKELGVELAPIRNSDQPLSKRVVPETQGIDASENITALAKQAMYEGKREQAIAYIRRIVSSNEKLGSAIDYHNLGVFALQIDDDILARDVFEKGVQFYPDNADLLADLGQVFDLTGDEIKAEIVFKQIDQKGLAKQSWRYFVLYSHFLRRQGRISEATQVLKEGVEQLPRETRIVENYADLLEETGNFDEAKAVLLSGLAINPSSADLHFRLGEYCWRHESLDEAEKHLSLAIRHHNFPSDNFLPDAFKLIARVRYELGKKKEAEEALSVAIQLRPSDMDLMALHTLLQQAG
jgi:tetratricopeptide (TPR) repeat protein